MTKAGEFKEEQKFNDDDYGEVQNVNKKKLRRAPTRKDVASKAINENLE